MKIVLVVCFAVSLALAQDTARNAPIRVGGNVQQASLISKATPSYPSEAKQNRIQGKVQLQILIAKDGHVADINVIGGPSELVQSAMDAVRQWIYKPTLLNGEPVEVITTVDVNYTLAE